MLYVSNGFFLSNAMHVVCLPSVCAHVLPASRRLTEGLQSYLSDACWREEGGRTSESTLVSQLLTQTLLLERAAAADIKGMQLLLEPLANVTEKWLKNAAQAAAFAWSLAGRLQPMVDAGKLGPGNPLWPLVFDRILVKCVDFDPQLHLRVLTMLRSVAGRLTRDQLGQYLQDTLYNSRKSRKRSRKQAKRATGEVCLDARRTYPSFTVSRSLRAWRRSTASRRRSPAVCPRAWGWSTWRGSTWPRGNRRCAPCMKSFAASTAWMTAMRAR